MSRILAAFWSRLSHNSQRAFCQQSQLENPYFKKYADKLAHLQKTCPEEYEQRLNDLSAKQKSRPHNDNKHMPTAVSDIHKQSHFTYQNKSLNDIMKLDLLHDKSKEDIEIIWKKFHENKSGLFAVLPGDIYKETISKLKKYPTFLFPLPRGQGYEFFMFQFDANSCNFTQLINYQTHKENAPVCLTITYFPELIEEKGIALMRGEFDDQVLTTHEAQCLTNQLQLYYSKNDKKKDGLLWSFNKQPEMFRHMDLVAELDYSL